MREGVKTQYRYSVANKFFLFLLIIMLIKININKTL